MPATSEHAFSLIEVVVVTVILLVIVGITFSSVRGGQTSANSQTVRTAALAIDEAVRSFRRDHASRAPVLGDSRDWPNANWGPSDRLGETYMRRRSEPLSDGSIDVVDVSGGSGGTVGRLRYARPTATTYRIIAETRSNGTWKSVCWFGTSDPGGGIERC